MLSFLPQNLEGGRRSAESDPKLAQDAYLPMWTDSANNTQRSSKHQSSSRKKKTFDPEKVLPDIESAVPLRPARNPPTERLTDLIPFLVVFKPIGGLFRKIVGKARPKDEDGTRDWFGKKKNLPPIDSNVPLESAFMIKQTCRGAMADNLLRNLFQSACSCHRTSRCFSRKGF